ncbi:MAG: serine/threonine-protein kinase, partial [Kordiimonas sp.]
MPKETPEKIDRYILGKALGSGSHGAVWQAEDSLLGRTVALKVLKDETDGGEGLGKSLQEARTLAKLNHPNIVTLYEVSEHEGQAYLVMEYLDGLPLNDYLENTETPPTFDDKISMAKQLIDALATAHENGIVHADIKPANILVRADGCPVLVDFGLAKVINASTDLETVTDDSLLNTMVHGTLSYMAPEVMRGDAADEKSDIFSLGAVFYEMFNGERAFKAPSDAETIHLILNIDPAPTTGQTADEIPEWLT